MDAAPEIVSLPAGGDARDRSRASLGLIVQLAELVLGAAGWLGLTIAAVVAIDREDRAMLDGLSDPSWRVMAWIPFLGLATAGRAAAAFATGRRVVEGWPTARRWSSLYLVAGITHAALFAALTWRYVGVAPAAGALGALGAWPVALVVACRRLVGPVAAAASEPTTKGGGEVPDGRRDPPGGLGVLAVTGGLLALTLALAVRAARWPSGFSDAAIVVGYAIAVAGMGLLWVGGAGSIARR